MYYLSDSKLLELAPAVVVGDVAGVHAEAVPGRKAVRSRARVNVLEYVKAPAGASAAIDVITPGGALAGVETRVPGAARFVAGERVLVFLAPSGEDAWRVVGMSRGKYHVDTSGGGPATVRLDLDGLTQIDPTTGRELPADLIPASAGRVYLQDLVATLRACLTPNASGDAR